MPALIRFFTASNYSHTFFTIPNVGNIEMGCEAASFGVACVPFDSKYRKNENSSYIVFKFNATEEQKTKGLEKALQKLQSGYGYLELPWFVWRWANKLIGRDIKHQDNWHQVGEICAELTSEFISDCGYSYLFNGFGRTSIHAQDLLEICYNNPKLFEPIEIKN